MADTHHRTTIGRHLVGTVGGLLLIAAGAFVGANLRYAIALQLPGPIGTLAANVSGSVAPGALLSEGAVTGVGLARLVVG